MNRVAGTSLFSTLPCGEFSLFSIFFFRFSFLLAQKKFKNANKRISDFFPPLDVFKRIFYFCSLICVFVLLLGCVFVLLCF